MVSLWRGTLGDLIPMIKQAIEDNSGLPVFVAVLALAYSEADDLNESRRLLEAFAATGFDLPLDPTWLTGMIAYADAAVEPAEPEFAGPMLELLSPFHEQWLYTDVATSGPISRTLGGLATVLRRYGEAQSYFSHAVEASHRTGGSSLSLGLSLGGAKCCWSARIPATVRRLDLLASRTRPESFMDTGRSHVARRQHWPVWAEPTRAPALPRRRGDRRSQLKMTPTGTILGFAGA